MRFVKLCGVAVTLLCSTAALAETNPAYTSWAKYRPGTNVVLKGASEAAGQKAETETTYTLVAVTPEKVTVEYKTAMTIAGVKEDRSASNIEIPAQGPATKPAETTPKAADIKQRDETLTIVGQRFGCHLIELTSEANGVKLHTRTWTCPEMPNLVVKLESSSDGPVAVKTTMDVTKVELK